MEITIGAKCWDGQRKKSLASGTRTVETVQIPEVDVKASDHTKLGAITRYALPLLLLPQIGVSKVMASPIADEAVPAMSDAVKSKILHAFDPLIDLIISLSFPIAGVMLAGGCLFIMVGNRERGMQIIQNAALGYILVQLSPMMLNLLVGIGDSV